MKMHVKVSDININTESHFQSILAQFGYAGYPSSFVNRVADTYAVITDDWNDRDFRNMIERFKAKGFEISVQGLGE
ncbi:MAG: hypothetical protein R3230_01035 [Nitrosopumilaceae archaeon]|nr:hypothetical protein [Nitrosopumilaceae archaeon]